MFCSNCGKEVSKDVAICPNCGCSLEHSSTMNMVEESPNVVGNHSSYVGPNGNSNLNSSNFTNNKPKKQINIILIICLVVIVMLIGLGIIYFIKSNSSSKSIFDKAINYVFDEIEENIPQSVNSMSSNYSFKAELDLSKELVEPQYYSFLNKLSFKGNAAIDYKNKATFTSMSINYDEASLLDLAFYASNNNIYANLGDLFDKYISVPVEEEEYNTFFELLASDYPKENIIVVLDEIKKALKNSLKEEYFVSDNEILTIENQEVETKKHMLVLDEKTYTTIARDVLTSLNNDNFLDNFSIIYSEIYSDLGGVELETVEVKSELKESIEAELEKLEKALEEDIFDLDEKIFISVYINSKDNSFTSFTIGSQIDGETELTVLDVTKISKEKYAFEITDENNLKICYGEVSLSDIEDNYKIYLNMGSEEAQIGNLEANISVLKGATDTYVYSIKSEKLGTIKLTLTNSYRYNETITLPSFSNSLVYTELTEEDGMTILQKLMEKDSVKQLMTDAEALISMMMFMM